MKKIFLYKLKNDFDRDSVVYIENDFSSITLCGACFIGGSFEEYEEIKTVLTKNEYNKLKDFESLEEKEKEEIINKLLSEENNILFNEIIEEEKEYLKEKYYFTDEEINEIFENYNGDYKDRSIICAVYSSYNELAKEYIWSLGILRELENYNLENYFDYDSFGSDLAEEENFYELASGKIIEYAY